MLMLPGRLSMPRDLAELVRRAMAAGGLTAAELVRRLPRRQIGAAYHVLSGRTRDPRASTVLALCEALDVDPDELLGVGDRLDGLDPELRRALDDLNGLPDEDRRLALDALRAILARLARAPGA